MVYDVTMKRLQIMIDEDLDAELGRMASVGNTSKAAIIRGLLRERLRGLPPLTSDPLYQMLGVDDYEPCSIDDVVYR